MKPKISDKRLGTFQMRMKYQELSYWKAKASIYSGGNLSELVRTALREWQSRYIVNDPRKTKGHEEEENSMAPHTMKLSDY